MPTRWNGLLPSPPPEHTRSRQLPCVRTGIAAATDPRCPMQGRYGPRRIRGRFIGLRHGPIGRCRPGLCLGDQPTAAGLACPLLAVVGLPVMWGFLPFAVLAVWGCGAPSSAKLIAAPPTHETLLLTRSAFDPQRSGPRDRSGRPILLGAPFNRAPARSRIILVLTDGRREIELGAPVARGAHQPARRLDRRPAAAG